MPGQRQVTEPEEDTSLADAGESRFEPIRQETQDGIGGR
jgi:hypothetical protein